jgi:hypothetical protein
MLTCSEAVSNDLNQTALYSTYGDFDDQVVVGAGCGIVENLCTGAANVVCEPCIWL